MKNELVDFCIKEEINNITGELRNHYIRNEFFVDPDRKFLSLLEKIIKFFEEDDLLLHIKQNEELYLNFKEKYEDAVKIITEYELGDKRSKDNTKYCRCDNDQIDYSPHYFQEFKNEQNYQIVEKIIIKEIEKEDTPPNNKNLDKLYNDYFSVLEEKRSLESKLQMLDDLVNQNKILKGENQSLLLENETLIKSQENMKVEINQIKDKMNCLSNENSNFLNYIENLKQQIWKNKKEKSFLKTKLEGFNHKEKQNCELKKKISSVLSQNMNLKEKYSEEKVKIKHYEKIIQDIKDESDNMKIQFENEKAKFCSNLILDMIESGILKLNISQEKIQLFYNDMKIKEYDNSNVLIPIHNSPSKVKIQEEERKSFYNTSHKSKLKNLYNENISLNKLFSNSNLKNPPSINDNLYNTNLSKGIKSFNFKEEERKVSEFLHEFECNKLEESPPSNRIRKLNIFNEAMRIDFFENSAIKKLQFDNNTEFSAGKLVFSQIKNKTPENVVQKSNHFEYESKQKPKNEFYIIRNESFIMKVNKKKCELDFENFNHNFLNERDFKDTKIKPNEYSKFQRGNSVHYENHNLIETKRNSEHHETHIQKNQCFNCRII